MSRESSDPTVSETLSWAHPVVRDWFLERFGSPTEPQALGWPHILAGRSTLISAPTGSGKTLAAFLACIDRLIRSGIEGTLTDRTEIVYVSPLKALGNDVQKNLDGPLTDIVALARARGYRLADIRTAVRTGDTLMPDRRAMLRRPPHILVTTPESLYILLTAGQSRERLRNVHTAIVDEIHAVADDKRGAHLALSLERLEHLAGRNLTRIGLSATQEPIETVAGFLAGSRPLPVIVHVRRTTPPDVAVEVPSSELGPVASNELWSEVYNRIADLVREHRSTLVFVNTRRLAERVSHQLIERLGAEAVAAHHGSLARRLRLDAEHRLKTGTLRVLVATASLELGIDIGSVDLVCQVGSPRSIAVALQRVGRAGHWRGALPKGRFFATTLEELGECAALVRAIRQGRLDRLIVPTAPLDVLAQQIVAMAAAEDWREDALFDVVRRAHSYREMPRAEFDEILEMLATGIAGRRGRMAAYLHRDRVNGVLRARRGAKLTAITSGGAIPETGLYTVVAEPEGTIVGTVDEDFAVESMAGDIMLLGNTSWRIRRVSIAGRVLVEDARGAPPTIPFWRGEAPARTRELSIDVGDLRRIVDSLSPGAHPGDATAGAPSSAEAVAWLRAECGLDQAGAEQFADYVVTGRAVLGVVPTTRTLVAERFFDEGGGMQLVIHAPFGARLNRAWGLALRKRFCRSFNYELQASATDNAINIALAEQHSFPLADVFAFLRPATVKEVLEQAALDSPIFGTRWRWDAGRSLALPRFRGGRKLPIHLLRLLSDDLLAAVFPDVAACQENIEGDITIPDHPLVREVMKDVLHEAMDLDGLIEVLNGIDRGEIRTVAVDTPVPSVFSHEVLNANPYAFLDDAPLEERRARAVELRRVLPEAVLTEIGRLDQGAIEDVASQAWPDVRGPEDLHDALLTLVLFPAGGDDDGSKLSRRIVSAARDWATWMEELRRSRRVVRASVADRRYWVASERVEAFKALALDAVIEDPQPALDQATPSWSDAYTAVAQGWLTHTGPTTSLELAGALALDRDSVEEAILRLEAAGWALRGIFRSSSNVELGTSNSRRRTSSTPVHEAEVPSSQFGVSSSSQPHEWCERRLLARIHRLTVGMLRKEIAPVTAATFMGWLFDWQHVSPGARAHGPNATLEVLRQLQGFEAPANAWEPQILARRVAGYDPDELDQLCLTGIVGWGRLSPHPATLRDTPGPRRVVPTSIAPVTFFVREDADWMRPRTDEPAVLTGLSGNARDVLEELRRAGASFFPDIVRASGHLKSEVEAALWELVAAGLVTADGFDNLRSLIDPRRRAGHGSGRTLRPRHSAGRWALIHGQAAGDRATTAEATAWMLLRRYGVVFRELVARESLGLTWRDLLVALRRLEDRGQIRGGRFVSGFIGEQFALPIAVDSLRAARHRRPSDEVITVAATDPLNLVGIIVPGSKVPANSGRTVSFRAGVPTEEATRLTPAI